MKKIICRLKGHIRDKENTFLGDGKSERFKWSIKCKRCGTTCEYESPHARLVGEEIKFGFTGD